MGVKKKLTSLHDCTGKVLLKYKLCKEGGGPAETSVLPAPVLLCLVDNFGYGKQRTKKNTQSCNF